MSKYIKTYIELMIDGRSMIILTDNYHGSPIMCYPYDILIGKEVTIKKYTKELFPEHQLKTGWIPLIRYI